MIVTVLAEKGGTGKTMVATNLAGMRVGDGRRVLLVDADRQGSSEHWASLRVDSRLPHVECIPLYGSALSRFLRTRVSDYDDVVIDVGAGDSDEMSTALSLSDCAVVPVRPTAADVWTMTLMDSRIGEAQLANPDLHAWALINQASTNPRNRLLRRHRRYLRRAAPPWTSPHQFCMTGWRSSERSPRGRPSPSTTPDRRRRRMRLPRCTE